MVHKLRICARPETTFPHDCPRAASKTRVGSGLSTGAYDLRSNRGAIAVSGEITLHHDRVYVQVCQPATGADSGVLIRTCEGRRDYTGGRNHFAPLPLLDDIPALALKIRSVMAACEGPCAA